MNEAKGATNMDSWQEDLETFMATQQQARTAREQRREEARREAIRFFETAVAPAFREVRNYLEDRFGRAVQVYNRSYLDINQADAKIEIRNGDDLELSYEVSVGFDNQQAFPIATASSPGVDFSEMPEATFSNSEHGPNVTEVSQADVRADLLRHYKFVVAERERAETGWERPDGPGAS